jgi:hypothetical protein
MTTHVLPEKILTVLHKIRLAVDLPSNCIE